MLDASSQYFILPSKCLLNTLPHHFDSNKHQYADRSGAVWALIGALVQGRVVDGKGGGGSLVDNSVRVSGLVVYK